MRYNSLCIGYIFILLLIFPGRALAQSNDFESWNALRVVKDLNKNTRLSLTQETRLRDNASTLKSIYLEPGIRYRVNGYLSLSGSYRFQRRSKASGYFVSDHVWYMGATGRYRQGDWEIRGRALVQHGNRGEFREMIRFETSTVQRYKLGVGRNLAGTPFGFSASGEIFLPMEKGQSLVIDKYRCFGGVDFAIDKRQSLDLMYGFQSDVIGRNPSTSYILAIEYTYRWR